jgi:hypothetical protein
MSTHTITLRTITPVTHDTNHLVLTRPEGYAWIPGQANHWGLDIEGFRDAGNPFTITSLPDEPDLEYVIKTYPTDKYPDHGGMTERIAKLQPGDKVFIDEASGDIQDKGEGVFIAGGAGITPFIPILKQRRQNGALNGCTLLFSNKTEEDIILRETWDTMPGLNVIYTVTDAPSPFSNRLIDKDFIAGTVGFDHRFYVCGPPGMMKSVIAALRDAGVTDENIVTEMEWLETGA